MNDIKNVMIDEDALQKRVREISEQISADYADRELILIGVLKGCLMFMADLVRHIALDTVKVEFVRVSSYGGSTKSQGVRITQDVEIDLSGSHVIIVEDILDTGYTLDFLLKYLGAREPASIEIATLLNKPSRRLVEVDAKYTGFDIPDEFVVGYGLDYAQKYRNLPYVGVLRSEVFEQS